MRRVLLALAVAAGLIGSFAIAFVAGQRLIGGVLLVVIGLGCAVVLYRQSGLVATIVTGVAYALAFALSHPLGDLIGPWPSVLVLALLAAVVAFAMSRPRGSA